MASLQEAFDALGPIAWEDVPQTQEGLREYISNLAQKCRLIVESVPEPPSSSTEESDSTQHETNGSSSNGVQGGGGGRLTKPYKVTTSPVRYNTTDVDILSYQSRWSKPLKPGSSRDNPHNIPMYKMQGHDGKGTWFGRRSVHEGMPFSHWKRKMAGELDDTLKWNTARLEKRQPPDRVVRGMGAVKKAEDVEVMDAEGRVVVGGVRVYDIAALFPKPTTPRDFVQVSFSWEDAVGPEGERGVTGRGGRRCRSWLSMSRPCLHPDLVHEDGYIRGQYDSLEFIREVLPVGEEDSSSPSKSVKSVTWSDPNLVTHEQVSDSASKKDKKGRKRGKTDSAVPDKQEEQSESPAAAAAGDVFDDEANPYPVEWIMVTRSDPGGSIPRWVIDKGTPKTIWADTVKFLDWASREEPPHGTADESKPTSRRASDADAEAGLSDDEIHPEERRNGLIANFAYLLNAGLERYAPQAVLDYVPYRGHNSLGQIASDEVDDDDEDDEDDTTSISSSTTSKKKDKKRTDTESMASQSKVSLSMSGDSQSDAQSQQHHLAAIDAMQPELEKKEKPNSQEKQLMKLASRKCEVLAKLEETRDEIELLRQDAGFSLADANTSSTSLHSQHHHHHHHHHNRPNSTEMTRARSSSNSSNRTQNKHAPSSSRNSSRTRPTNEHRNLPKTASSLFATESKLLKQLTKIESDQLKTASKVEARQNKQHESEEKSRNRAQIEALKRETDNLRKEVERLRTERGQWVDLVSSLQNENIKLSKAVDSQTE